MYFAYVSFVAALCQFTGKARGAPAWLVCLEPPEDIPPEYLQIFRKLGIVDFRGKLKDIPNDVHPEFLNMFKRSHIVDFSGKRTRSGVIIDVLRCDWIDVADVLFKAKVPMWLDWGNHPLTVTPRASWMMDYRPQLVDLDPPSVERTPSLLPPFPLPPQPQSPPILSALEVIARRRSVKDQLPGETHREYFRRRQKRHEAKMKTETARDKQVRLGRERTAAGRQYPGRKGPAVYYWEPDTNGFRVRTLQTRREAQRLWGEYSGAQKVFDSFANEWDCCTLFGADDSDSDSNYDEYGIPRRREEPMPKLPLPDEEPMQPMSSLPSLHEEPMPSLISSRESMPSLPPPHEEPMPSPCEELMLSRPSLHEEPMPSLSSPREPILPPPHEEPMPSPREESTSSLPSLHEEPMPSLISPCESMPSLPPPHEEPMPSPREEPMLSLPPLHEEPMPSMSSPREPSLPPPHEESMPSPREESTSSLPPSHEESISLNLSLVTSLEADARSQGIIAQSLPYLAHNCCPTPSHRDDSPIQYDRYHRRRNPRDDSPGRRRRYRDGEYSRPYRDSRSNSPRRDHQDPLHRDRYHGRYLEDPSRDGGSRSMHRRSRSRTRGSYQRNSDAIVGSDADDDLLTLSRAIVLSVNPLDSTIHFGIQTDSLEDYIYYRFGFRLDENPYTGVPSSKCNFGDWLEVLRSLGCHQLDSLPANRQPIKDFLECLLSTDNPLRDVPAKFWDLNASNSASLNLPASFVHIEPKKFLDGKTHYLIRPVGLHASRDSSWVLAVDAMTALECVRRRLGPHTIDIADFLINRGIPFRTLRLITLIPGPHTPPRPILNLLGTRPRNYRFDIADFSTYQTLCDSVLKGKPFCRATLCMGGIVARLAREIIPNTAALLGPSQEALDGYQKIMVCDDGTFCDDDVSDTYTDLICGVYKVSTIHHSMYTGWICIGCY